MPNLQQLPYKTILQVNSNENARIKTGIDVIDNFFGGGLVDSEVIQIGGSPGSGKSSLLMQLSTILIDKGYKSLYFSGEESLGQIKLRAIRLNALRTNLVCTETLELSEMFKIIEEVNAKLIIVDSMPMIYSNDINAPIGSDKQVRETMLKFTHYIKQTNRIAIVVGHGTKQGTLAGLLKIQHMVDVTLYLKKIDGNKRILESIKNRFGATMEILLTMDEQGFIELLPDYKGQTNKALQFKKPKLLKLKLIVIGIIIIEFIFFLSHWN